MPEQDKPERASENEFAKEPSNAPSTQPAQENFEATISIHASAAAGDSNSYDTNPQAASHVSRVRRSGASRSHASSVQALPVVQALTRYRDVEFIGEGTFGAVFKAVDSVLERSVAIKVLKLDAPQGLFKFFLGEAQRLAKLDHPGICKVFDFGVESGQPYIVTEWLSGKSLADQPKPMDWRSACNVVAQIADAMAYAHRHDVIHRDLKPPNVMIDAEGRTRVIDFGLAVNEDELTSEEVCYGGSPAYMAPEQTNGRLHVLDGRVDVWAMGVILYELVTSRRPFRGQTSSDLMSKIREKPVVSPRTFDASLPVEVERIILASLAKRPEKRTATAGDLAAQLRALLTSSSITTATNSGLSQKPAVTTLTSEATNETSLRSSTNNEARASGRKASFLIAAIAIMAFCAIAWRWNGRAPNESSNSSAESNAGAAKGISAAANKTAEANNFFRVEGNRPASGQKWVIDASNPDSPDILNGDRVSLAVSLDQAMHIYLIWLGTDSGITVLHPGPIGSSQFIGDPDIDRPAQALTLPVGTITSTPSTETVLMIATLTPFKSRDRLLELLAILPRPDMSRMVEPGKSRGIHFDASRWEDSSSTPILMRDAFEPTIEFIRSEFGDTTIMQAVSFVSGSL